MCNSGITARMYDYAARCGYLNLLLLQIAASFDVEQLQKQYPATYQESMNTVLVQEALRYNALLEVVAASLKECAKAVKGLVVMSPGLEAVSNSMYDNQVSSLCMCMRQQPDSKDPVAEVLSCGIQRK